VPGPIARTDGGLTDADDSAWIRDTRLGAAGRLGITEGRAAPGGMLGSAGAVAPERRTLKDSPHLGQRILRPVSGTRWSSSL